MRPTGVPNDASLWVGERWVARVRTTLPWAPRYGGRAQPQDAKCVCPGPAQASERDDYRGASRHTRLMYQRLMYQQHSQPTHHTMPDHFPITPTGSVKPLGPYSPAMGFERLVFVSGQGAVDPATNRLVGADVETQTEQCLRNVQTILEAAGSSLQHVLRCGVFLIDMNEFSRMNAVYGRVFGDHRPARTTVQAAALPGDGLRVEIDCIAYTK